MRKFLRPLTLMLLVVGLLFLPASPAAAARYQPGDHLSMSADFIATVTLHDNVYIDIPDVEVWAPTYVTVQGRATVINNDTGRPVGVMNVDWMFGVIDPESKIVGYANVGRFTSQSTDVAINFPEFGVLESEAVIGSAGGQYKNLVVGDSTMTYSGPVISAPNADTYTVNVPARIDFDIRF